MFDAVDLFAGPGGWDVAASSLGLRVVGIEVDPTACATRRAAGHATVEGDVRDYGPGDFPAASGLIASPPCQTFSIAGGGAGRAALDVVLSAAAAMAAREPVPADSFSDVRTALVLEPLRWVLEAIDSGTPYEWLAFEQVPTVLPVWEAFAAILRAEGYVVSTETLSAERYGVPQTRRRAVLVALWERCLLPHLEPTHSRYYPRTPQRLDEGLLPWVSMAAALGWTEGGARWVDLPTPDGSPRLRDQTGTVVDLEWPQKRPATVLAGRDLVQHPGATANRFNGSTKSRNDGVRVSPAEAAVLQTFPADYPWQGTRSKVFEQIGNAVPPLLARAVLASLLRKAPA